MHGAELQAGERGGRVFGGVAGVTTKLKIMKRNPNSPWNPAESIAILNFDDENLESLKEFLSIK